MTTHLVAAMALLALGTQNLVTYLQGLFGPLFLGIVGIAAIFFLFTRGITRFVQFMMLALAIAVVFYTPSIVQVLVTGIASALGIHRSCPDRRSASQWTSPLTRISGVSKKDSTSFTTFGCLCRCLSPWIFVFGGIAVPYVVFLVAIGLPFNHSLVWLYVLPPGVLTWLTARPVIENKRLPELVSLQLRYLSEPKSWCRMALFAEKDDGVVSVRVRRQHPPARSKRGTGPRLQFSKAKARSRQRWWPERPLIRPITRPVIERRQLPTVAYGAAQWQLACAES
jgi:hypothetical protein